MASEGELRALMRRKQLVRFGKCFDSPHAIGYIAGVGSGLFMLHRVGDTIRFDGYQVHRIRDVRRMQADPHADFVEAVINKRRDRRPTKPRVRLGGFGDALRSAARRYPLVTIHRERVDPDICQIGAVVAVGEHRVTLHEIRPDASWRDGTNDYALREITRVEFGGDYEDALALIGGLPPSDPASKAKP